MPLPVFEMQSDEAMEITVRILRIGMLRKYHGYQIISREIVNDRR